MTRLKRPSRRALLPAWFAMDPVRAHDRLIGLGPVVTLNFLAFRVTYLLGADANRFVLTNPDIFEVRGAYASLGVVSGATPLLRSDGSEHQRRRQAVRPAFSPQRIATYQRAVIENAHHVINKWRPGDIVNLATAFERALRRSTISSLFGSRLADSGDLIARELAPGLRLIADDPIRFAMRRSLRTPMWRRANSGRARVQSLVRGEIEARRHEPSLRSDLLDALLGQEMPGVGLSEEEVVDQVISMIGAGYETANATLAWACHVLLTHPSASQHETDHVVSEALRLFPPAVVTARVAAKPVRFAGRHIPAGRLVLASPYVTHRSPELWSEPLRFDPSRWNRNQPDYAPPDPYAYLPFGAGPHRCIGAHMARMQVIETLNIIRSRTVLRPVSNRDPRPRNLAAMGPKRVEAVVLDVRDYRDATQGVLKNTKA